MWVAPHPQMAGNASLFRKEGQTVLYPLLLLARERGWGDERLKKIELLLFIPVSLYQKILPYNNYPCELVLILN